MPIYVRGARRRGLILLACLAAAGATGAFAVGSHVFAEDEGAGADAKPSDTKPSDAKSPDKAVKKRRHSARKAAPKPDVAAKEAPGKETVAKEDVTASVPKPTGKPPVGFDFAAQLDKAGAASCRGQVNAVATATMGSVEKFNTVSNWSQVAGDKRAVSVSIGQKYASGSAVPFGVAQVITAPNQQGSCDGFSVQVFPSPLSCAKLRDSIQAQHGRQIGDLAGIPLMQDAAGRTMLVPTAADTCVLVATKSFYAK